MDVACLHGIERWRALLAHNVVKRNPDIRQHDLKLVVNVTILRLLFLRMCEERGIERYGPLGALLRAPAVYRRLKHLCFRIAASRSHHAQKRSEDVQVEIDDKPLQEIITGLCCLEGPWDFSVLPADILGQVYEQFLVQEIRIGQGAKVHVLPQTKKAAGIYYTPANIVQYIVEHTIGQLLKGSTPARACQLGILDPACGAGAFLLAAYQHLLDWHRDWYLTDDPLKHGKELYQSTDGNWRLTTAERSRILLNNIHGVDIDPVAAEAAKLSLVLKLLDRESQERVAHQGSVNTPSSLLENIQCGNALIGPDFCEASLRMGDDGERTRINVFDWRRAFRRIMQAGGFDAVIGNPPWGQKAVADDRAIKRYLWDRFPSSRGIYDLFRPFVEQGIRLLADGGMFGMVLPDIVLLKDYQATRQYLLEQLSLEAVDWWGMSFPAAVIDAATIIGAKRPAAVGQRIRVTVNDQHTPLRHEIPQTDFWANPRQTFNLRLTATKRELLQRLAQCPRMGDYFEIHEGVHSGNIRGELFVIRKTDASCRELYFGRREIRSYLLEWAGRYIRLAALPRTKSRARYANLGKPEWHERDKLLVRRTGDHVLAAVDRQRRYATNNFFVVFPRRPCSLDLDGLCALLNSRLMTWFFRAIEPRHGRVFAELKIKHLKTFPLPSLIRDGKGCAGINRLGAARSKLATELVRSSNQQNKAVAQRRIENVDRKVNALACQLLDFPQDFDA
jgi:hypothetical protein